MKNCFFSGKNCQKCGGQPKKCQKSSGQPSNCQNSGGQVNSFQNCGQGKGCQNVGRQPLFGQYLPEQFSGGCHIC